MTLLYIKFVDLKSPHRGNTQEINIDFFEIPECFRMISPGHTEPACCQLIYFCVILVLYLFSAITICKESITLKPVSSIDVRTAKGVDHYYNYYFKMD